MSRSSGGSGRHTGYGAAFATRLSRASRSVHQSLRAHQSLWDRLSSRSNDAACIVLFALCTAAVAGCEATPAQATPARENSERVTGATLTRGQTQSPDEDAVILLWDQRWTLEKDGTVHRRVHQRLRLLNRRPIRSVADPRLDFVEGQDKLVIHKAQTILPDGKIMPVPDYSFNIAAPNDVAGWPEYAGWQQQIVSFSGIEPGVVLELDYEVITPAGVLPWLEADLRLLEEYPTVRRVVSVTVPKGVTIRHHGGTDPPAEARPAVTRADGAATYRWEFTDLPADRSEPQSPPWQLRSGRLRFTTCPGNAEWVAFLQKRIEQAATQSDSIRKFAQATVESETDPTERVRKIAKKLHDSFNFVGSPKALQSLACRPADTVLRANYGNPLESAALCLAMVQSLGMSASLAIGVERDLPGSYDELISTTSALAGAVVVVDGSDGLTYVHPQHGIFTNPAHWGRHRLLTLNDRGEVEETVILARGEDKPSELTLTGKLAIDEDGKAAGELRIRATGVFFNPKKLDTADAQKKLVKNMVKRVLGDLDVPSHSLVTLSDEVFRATANVASEEALKEYGPLRALRLGDGPAFLLDVHMPLASSERRNDVKLAGAFREHVDLTIELADGLQTSILPTALAEVRGDWGRASQSVEQDGQTVRFRRHIEVTQSRIAPDTFAGLREAINDLRAAQSSMLAFKDKD